MKNTFLVTCLCGFFAFGCGQAGGKEEVSSVGKTYLAENVILDNSAPLSLTDNGDVVKIRPEQILLSSDGSKVGKLTSTNLKDALQNELAVKLSDVIVGRWRVENKLARISHYIEPDTTEPIDSAEIEIDTNGQITLISGCMTFVNIGYCKNNTIFDKATISFFGNNVMLISYLRDYPEDNTKSYSSSALLTIPEVNQNSFIAINMNTDTLGAGGSYKELSIFTRNN